MTNIAAAYNIPLNENFYALSSDTVGRILEAAKACKYRQPKNANGSKARYFYAYLNRLAKRED